MMSSSSSNPYDNTNISRTNILAESWSTVSNDYNAVLVPRFAPWTQDALDALQNAINNNMKCSCENIKSLVLCCGPGQELLPIAKILGPTSTVLGTDLAPGMIDVAKKRVEDECCSQYEEYKGRITADVGDAMTPPPGPYQVIFSAFGLQQLPNPMQALQSWIQVMEPGGICVCLYWSPSAPKAQGDNSPFTMWTEIVKKKIGRDTTDDEPWDRNIESHVTAAGAEIIEDQFIAHDICWNGFEDMFDGLTNAGPWHAMRLRRGDEFVDELGQELKAYYPQGKSLCHESFARLVIVRRKRGEGAGP